jgi:hypothetical protein
LSSASAISIAIVQGIIELQTARSRARRERLAFEELHDEVVDPALMVGAVSGKLIDVESNSLY